MDISILTLRHSYRAVCRLTLPPDLLPDSSYHNDQIDLFASVHALRTALPAFNIHSVPFSDHHPFGIFFKFSHHSSSASASYIDIFFFFSTTGVTATRDGVRTRTSLSTDGAFHSQPVSHLANTWTFSRPCFQLLFRLHATLAWVLSSKSSATIVSFLAGHTIWSRIALASGLPPVVYWRLAFFWFLTFLTLLCDALFLAGWIYVRWDDG